MSALRAVLQRRAKDTPNDIVFEGSDVVLTAADLLSAIDEMASIIHALDAHTVALLADNSPHWAVVDLCCQIYGICLVPVPTFFTAAQVEHLLRSSSVDLLIYEQRLASKVASGLLEKSDPGPLNAHFNRVKLPGVGSLSPPGTSKITYTSGSTGEPKGACLSFEQCLNVARSLAGAVALPKLRHMCVLPLSTLLENIGGIYMPLLCGGCAVIYSSKDLGMEGSSGLDAEQFLGAIERAAPNTLILVPQLLAVLDAGMERGWDVPCSVQFAAVGGAKVAPAMIDRVRRRGLPVYEGYGLSECGSVVSLNTSLNHKAGTSGKVLPHVEVSEADGELIVSGNAFLGYLNQPETWGVKTVDTGDLGHVDSDGFLCVSGRKKNILISSFGRNISPEWVESELLGSGVFQQLVVVGDAKPACGALVLPWDCLTPDIKIQTAINRANSGLPDYAQVQHWSRLDHALSASNGLLTDNGRPRRDQIQKHYFEQIESMYIETQESIVL
jgi:long-chain acyl-CoA synthetase